MKKSDSDKSSGKSSDMSSDKSSSKVENSQTDSGDGTEFVELRQQLRTRIDGLDEQILQALNERAKCAIEVGEIKKKHGQRLFDPQREEKVLGRLVEINSGPLAKEAVLRLFERIIDESRRVERTEVYDKKS